MKVLIVGGSGFLGREVVRQAVTGRYAVSATYLTRPGDQAGVEAGVDWRHLDLRHRDAVAAVLDELRPQVVINTAYQQTDWATTADGAAHVALAAQATGSRLIHISSDAVFSGRATSYDETSTPDPINPYGAAKAAAETAIRAITPHAVITRTSLILGNGDSPHETRVHALATGRSNGVLFTDDIRCPIHVTDLAAALLELATTNRTGIHHTAGTDAISRYDLGILIAQRDGLDPTTLPTGLRADTTIPGPIALRLDSTTTQHHLHVKLRGAREFLTTPGGSIPGTTSPHRNGGGPTQPPRRQIGST